jgi:hypothetical protein
MLAYDEIVRDRTGRPVVHPAAAAEDGAARRRPAQDQGPLIEVTMPEWLKLLISTENV